MARQKTASTNPDTADTPPADEARDDGQEQSDQNPSDVDLGATAAEAVDQVQDSAGRLVDQVKQLASSRLSEQQERLAGGIGMAAKLLRAAGEQVREQDQATAAGYLEGAADRVQALSGTLREQEPGQLLEQTEGVARRRPGLFLGGGLALGFLGTRFLQSSTERQQEVERQAAERQAAKERREAEKAEADRQRAAERQAAADSDGDDHQAEATASPPRGTYPPDVDTTLPPTYSDALGNDPMGLGPAGLPPIPDDAVIEVVEVEWEFGVDPTNPPNNTPGRGE